jgi:ABC-type transport system involved in multi-copper enzyme maturation permease subunit
MTTLTPTRPASPQSQAGLARLLRAEWTKLRTVRGWVVSLLVALLLTILIGLFNAGHSHVPPCTTGPNGPACQYVLPTGPGGEPVTDTYFFVHRPLTTDGSITVRVTSLTGVTETGQTPQEGPAQTQPTTVPWSKAGLIITTGTSQGSPYAAVMVTGGHGTRMQWNYTGDTAGPGGDVSTTSPRWLRLTRVGDVITGDDSTDGTHWTTIGAVTLPGLATTVQAGLFVTSPGSTQQTSQQLTSASGTGAPTDATATFDRPGLQGGWAGDSWTGTFVHGGPDSPTITGHAAGYHRTGDVFTITGSGDIAPDVTDGVPINVVLVGAFLALIAVIVVGTQFMTVEYRRGLIRTTLAANPRRGRALAAKAIVLGAATFATELAGAAGAVLIGTPLLRGSGNPVYPATALTELRVIAGTAALTAVMAVFALAIGAILRHGAAAVTVAITAVVLPYLLTAAIPVLPAAAADWVLRVTPAAGFAINQITPAYPQVDADYTPFNGYFPLTPWAGLAVTCGYAALALALATYLLRRRDA